MMNRLTGLPLCTSVDKNDSYQLSLTMNTLYHCYSLGKILGLAPNANICQRCYTITIFAVITVSVTISTYNRIPLYKEFVPIKVVLTGLQQLVMYLFCVDTVLGNIFWKVEKWNKINNVLKMPKIAKQTSANRKFLMSQITFWICHSYMIFVWTDVQGLDFYKQYFIDVILIYYQYYYYCLLIILVQIITQNYEEITWRLKQSSTIDLHLKIFQIRDAVDTFNEIFGWTAFLLILTSSIILIDYVDDLFKNSYGYSQAQYIGCVIANIITISYSLVCAKN